MNGDKVEVTNLPRSAAYVEEAALSQLVLNLTAMLEYEDLRERDAVKRWRDKLLYALQRTALRETDDNRYWTGE